MKILFFGDSYTGGDELWEEQNIPNYSTLSQKAASKVTLPGIQHSIERKELTYTGFIKKMKPDWEIFNFGFGGAGQSMISANAYSNYTRLKTIYPDDKFICIVQDTFRNRFTYYNNKGKHYFSINADNPRAHLDNYPDTKDLVKFTETFLNDENLGVQFYCQSMGVMEFFRSMGVPALNFSFYNHELIYNDDEKDLAVDIMKQEYLKNLKLFPTGAVQRIMDHYKITSEQASLPGHHIKHQYHEIVAKDLVEYIETNMIQ
jgi:hypothetical protein